jgi:polyphosphate kinase
VTDLQQPAAPPVDLDAYELYFNRELSWLQFNDRVLQLAEDESVPLLERVKFCAIYSNNLDEFFMVRVAGLQEYVDAGIDRPREDGRSPAETIAAIGSEVREQTRRQSACLDRVLRPELAEHGIRIQTCHEIDPRYRDELAERFRRQIFPVLTPLAVGLGRPFPYISNLSLSLAVLVRDPQTEQETFARVKVPKEMLPRFVPVGDGRTFVPLEDLIAEHLDTLFPGMEILDVDVFRVTRDADFTIDDEADDLMRAVEQELRRRRFGEVVRVEVGAGMSHRLREPLVRALEIEEGELFEVEGLLDLKDLFDIVRVSGFPDLHYEPWSPVTQPRLQPDEDEEPDVMSAMRKGDILVHHPYDSFATSVERLVEQAVADPKVLAIKQTVYRTSDDSPLVPALIRAAERGKQAVCMVELKARFDERANIGWARAMEEAGVHVVYGLPNLKTHAKCILIVRREGDGVRHYVHVGTGNYHPTTARLYTDFGLLTCDEQMGADVADMFNQLTGFARPGAFRRVLVAPAHMRDGIVEEIDRTIAARQDGRPARIAMKMNSLVDKRCIRALYRASQAGVDVELNIRGICCLRPGVEGVSERIRVHSVVGRFLEHSRIYAFERGGEETIYIGSADLMPRNLDTRVELLAPVRDEALRAELLDTLERCMADDTNAWTLAADGAWGRRAPSPSDPRNAQVELMSRHAARAVEAAAGAG